MGSTIRYLHDRVKEHFYRYNVHGEEGDQPVKEHMIKCMNINEEIEVKVLSRQKDEIDTRISEALFIKKMAPRLNNKTELGSILRLATI